LKTCTKCKTNKLESQFGVDRGTKDGLHYWCKQCNSKNTLLTYHAKSANEKKIFNSKRHARRMEINPESKVASDRRYYEKHKLRIRTDQGARAYGLTREQYVEYRSRPCEICGQHKIDGRPGTGMCVDHDHVTGKLRGTLCMHCNRAIGLLKDSSEILRKAADYLDRYRGLHPRVVETS